MWFIGLLLGAALGGSIGDEGGAIVGAIGGAVIAFLLRRKKPVPVEAASRLEALENQVREQGAAIELLRARLRNLEAGAAPPETAVAAQVDSGEMQAGSPVDAAIDEPSVVASAPVSTDGTAGEPGEAVSAIAPEPAPEPEPLSSSWARSPSPAGEFVKRILGWFTGGNTVVRVGIVILFFGVAFLFKYAYDHAHVPPELRVAGAMLGGMALGAIGWWQRQRRPGFATALQGGGVGIMYLTIFAAFRLYGLLPPAAAFGLLAALSVFSVILALRQNAQALALLAVSGGFLAPVLASTGGGSHVALFAYYTLLNLGILAIAARRAWRLLNLTGFVFTFVIGASWGARFYRPDLWASTQPFLAAFFLIYLAIPTLFARHAERTADRYLDGTLVFGLPVVAAALQVHLVREFEYGMAISALVMSGCYVAASRWVRRRHGNELPLLTAGFASLAFIAATLAIPLALDARWSSAAWALEGAAVVWLGLRQSRWLPRVAGYLLQLGAAVMFLDRLGWQPGPVAVLNRDCLGFALLAGSAFFTAWQLDRQRERATEPERMLRHFPLAAALAWWLVGGLREISMFASDPWEPGLSLLFTAATCAALEFLRVRLSWTDLRWPAMGGFAVAVLIAALERFSDIPPLSGAGLAGWPALFAVHFAVLRRQDRAGLITPAAVHAAGYWLLVCVLASQTHWLLGTLARPDTAWPLAGVIAVVALMLAFAATATGRFAWPFETHRSAYRWIACGVLAGVVVAFTVLVNFASDGSAAPLPYVPLLNPLDLASLGALLSVEIWMRRIGGDPPVARWFGGRPWLRYGILGAAAFLVLNGSLLHALHHFAGTPLDPEGVMNSTLAQAALSLFWTLISLALMVAAHRWKRRPSWIVGAALLAVTVAKLFLFDLAHVGSVERIVSFVGVGLLMLVVGWFAPVPPKRQAGA